MMLKNRRFQLNAITFIGSILAAFLVQRTSDIGSTFAGQLANSLADSTLAANLLIPLLIVAPVALLALFMMREQPLIAQEVSTLTLVGIVLAILLLQEEPLTPILIVVPAVLMTLFIMREQMLVGQVITVTSLAFMIVFTIEELDGLEVLYNFLKNAFETAPNFVEGIVDYFRIIATDPVLNLLAIVSSAGSVPKLISNVGDFTGSIFSDPLLKSVLVGAIAGGLLTTIVYLSSKGHLRLPRLSVRAIGIAVVMAWLIGRFEADVFHSILVGVLVFLLTAYLYVEDFSYILSFETITMLFRDRHNILWPPVTARHVMVGAIASWAAYAFDGGFWNLIYAAVIMIIAVSLLLENELAEFFQVETYKKLTQPEARPFYARGLLLGGVVGAISSQILMFPTQHCTYQSGIVTAEYRLGLVITVVSAVLLLIPVWTIIQRGTFRTGDTGGGYFKGSLLPYIFLFPTLLVLIVFLYYPGIQVLTLSLKLARFGIPRERFICMDNYVEMAEDATYRSSFMTTFSITMAVVLFSMGIGLAIAALASQKVRGIGAYRTFLIWPYAVSPVVAGVIFLYMFNPVVGIVNWGLFEIFGTRPQWFQEPNLAPWVVIAAAVWNALGFNVLFYIAGLQNVPNDVLEAASIDGANRFQRFIRITFPLLSPYSFFLLVTNVTYSFFGIFGAVDNLTQGGPWRLTEDGNVGGTNVLIYQLYDAFNEKGRIGEAAAQSLVLFLLVAGITILQFQYVESRVTYGGE